MQNKRIEEPHTTLLDCIHTMEVCVREGHHVDIVPHQAVHSDGLSLAAALRYVVHSIRSAKYVWLWL